MLLPVSYYRGHLCGSWCVRGTNSAAGVLGAIYAPARVLGAANSVAGILEATNLNKGSVEPNVRLIMRMKIKSEGHGNDTQLAYYF